ncbi:MAG TPA: carboxypeptidase regulatory-like domain-containing protein [Vicinamibacterales bacterium]|nr:carboxypeptidase regulatory-like domain-containing protein [Vicinamibacterales bacterium]
MNCTLFKAARLAAAFVAALSFAVPSFAQVFTGRIDVTVEDSTGGRLPGVTVELSGPSSQSEVTDAQGQTHFLNLPVGIYAVKASLSGFGAFNNPQVQVATGAATPLNIKMTVAGQVETVNVTAAPPIVDTKRESTTTNITIEELQNIPTARDPWVVMQTVPTIYVDRVNVGGSESGQQSNYFGKGSLTTENTWSIDGVPITDMGATGSTPTYYDFDMFQEMSVTTGGADVNNVTPGVALNLVLKKGSNTPHGNANFYWEGEGLQGNNMDPTLAKTIGGSTAACANSGFTQHCGNRTNSYKDRGFDLGGPILKDKLWAWGRLGQTDVQILTLTGVPDNTTLKNYAFKADAQANAITRLNFTFFEGNKVKNGRGASATKPAEATWNQTGPTKYYKGEGNWTLGQSLFVAARYAYISGGFALAPQGGLNTAVYLDDSGTWHGSYEAFNTTRPQYYTSADANYFAGKHEVKFGFSYRKTPVDSLSNWPHDPTSQLPGYTIWNTYPSMFYQVTRDTPASTSGQYASLFVTDTISLDRLTIQAGVRFDHSTSSLVATAVTAVPSIAFPGLPANEQPAYLLPQLSAAAASNAYAFNVLAPRVGLTYALTNDRKTIARASYAMFASQLPANASAFISPIQYSYALYDCVDKNGNKACDPGEVTGFEGTSGVNLTNPSSLTTANKIGDITSPKTHELMFGIDHEVMPNVGVTATLTYRRNVDVLWNPPLGATSASYVQNGTFSGTFANVGTVSVPIYGLPASVDPTAGYITQNRPDYYQRYLGFELAATKRMSNHWMGRVGFATTSWDEYFTANDAKMDPTVTPVESLFPATFYTSSGNGSGPLVNGGPVAVQTSGSGKSNIYLVAPKYQFTANGLYQGPWGIDFGANLILRQGYAEPFYRSNVSTGDSLKPLKNVLIAGTADGSHLPGVADVDVRVEKMFKFGSSNVGLDLDVFNLLNAGTTLGIQYDARKTGATGYNNTLEIMQPRIARLGVRFFF